MKPVSSWGRNCPVKILKDYLDARLVLTPASGNDWLFPGMNVNLLPNKHTTFSYPITSSQCQFDIYHRLLRTQFDIPEMIARGVSLDRTDPYVERQGRECMLGVNVVLSPACMRRNQQHKYRYSEWRYTDPTTEALTVVTGMEFDPQRDLQQRHKKRKQLMRQFLLKCLADHYHVYRVDRVADVGSLTSMATHLGGIYLSQEDQRDLDYFRNRTSRCRSANINDLKATKSGTAQGTSPSMEKLRDGTGRKLLNKTKVANRSKPYLLTSQQVTKDGDVSINEPHIEQVAKANSPRLQSLHRE